MKRTFEEIREIVESCDCHVLGNHFRIRFQPHPNSERWFVQVGMDRECVYTHSPGTGWGGKYEVSPWSTHDEIVKKIFGACLAYVEHETREGFFWKGQRIFNPHVTVDALASICDRTMSRNEEIAAPVNHQATA